MWNQCHSERGRGMVMLGSEESRSSLEKVWLFTRFFGRKLPLNDICSQGLNSYHFFKTIAINLFCAYYFETD